MTVFAPALTGWFGGYSGLDWEIANLWDHRSVRANPFGSKYFLMPQAVDDFCYGFS